jgi:hypothetical protein
LGQQRFRRLRRDKFFFPACRGKRSARKESKKCCNKKKDFRHRKAGNPAEWGMPLLQAVREPLIKSTQIIGSLLFFSFSFGKQQKTYNKVALIYFLLNKSVLS